FRDGQHVVTSQANALDRAALIRHMVGRDLSAIYPTRSAAPGQVALEVRHLTSRESGLKDVTLSVRRGEIVGVAGLVGSGRTELAETIFGLRSFDSGSIAIDGASEDIRSPSD